MTALIYLLRCPLTGEVRYVGKCINLKARLRQHIHEARCGGRGHKSNWIRRVLNAGLKPIIELDRSVSNGLWKAVEVERIAYYRSIGCKLTNITNGGDEPAPLTEEGKAILSERMSKRVGTPEGRKKQSELMKRLCADSDWVRKRAESAKQSRSRPEYRAAQSERFKANWSNPAYVEKWKGSRAKVLSDPEFKSKHLESVRISNADPDKRARTAEKIKFMWQQPGVREQRSAAIKAARMKKMAAVS